MSSKDLLKEYNILKKKGGFIIKEVKGYGGKASKYKIASMTFCKLLIGKKIKITLEDDEKEKIHL